MDYSITVTPFTYLAMFDYLILSHTLFPQIYSPAMRKRIYSSLSETSEAKLNIMHAAFLAVQYDPSDNGLLMKCQVMVNGLCSGHFVMPSFEVSFSFVMHGEYISTLNFTFPDS